MSHAILALTPIVVGFHRGTTGNTSFPFQRYGSAVLLILASLHLATPTAARGWPDVIPMTSDTLWGSLISVN